MPELKLKQLQYESDTWKRLLGFISDENVHLKNRLSEILKDSFDDGLLDNMENFQSRFIKEDNLVAFLRNDITEFDKLLVREIFEDGQLKKNVVKQIRKFRNNIKNAEEQFGKMKLEFNSFLSENI